MSTVPPLTPIAPATSSPRISGIPPAKLTTRAEVRRFEAVKRLPWLRLGDAAGLTREEMWEERHVVPGVRFAVDAYVTFARTRPWVEAVDYRKELTTEEWQRVLTGDAARRDPVCHLSPDHQIVADAVRAANEEPGKADFVPRVRTVHRG